MRKPEGSITVSFDPHPVSRRPAWQENGSLFQRVDEETRGKAEALIVDAVAQTGA